MNIVKEFLNNVNTGNYRERAYIPKHSDPTAEFCLNNCPHDKCKGTCAEIRELAKIIYRSKTDDVSNVQKQD